MMAKRLLLLPLLLVCFVPLAAARLTPSKAESISTVYFDISYGKESSAFAERLASLCDKLYEETCAYLQEDPYLRHIPVSITTETDEQNAYATLTPARGIVLYDVPFSGDLGSVWTDTSMAVFSHELFHVVSMAMRGPFWKGVSSVLGDCYSPIFLNASDSILEGSAVLFESRGGEGRLHSPLYQAKILQAKLEGFFPVSYLDVTGLRDTSPSGDLTYTFSGAFLDFVIHRYGMEHYLEFLRLCNNALIPLMDFSFYFHQAFGVWPQDVWKEFSASIPILHVHQGVAHDLPLGNRLFDSGLSYQSHGGELYLDGKKILTKSGITSADTNGRELVYLYNDSSFSVDSVLVLRDLASGRKERILSRHADAAVFLGDEVAYIDHVSQKQTLHYKGESIPLPVPVTVLSSWGESHVAFIDATHRIVVLDPESRECVFFTLPQGMVPYSLSFDGDEGLLFSWAKEGTLLRLGRLSLNGSLFLMDEDVSGGVGKTHLDKDGCLVERRLYSDRVVSRLALSSLRFREDKATVEKGTLMDGGVEVGSDGWTKGDYNPWRYLSKGTVTPLAVAVDPMDRTSSYAVGLFRMSGDPYQDYSLLWGTGYSFSKKQGVALSQLSGYLRFLKSSFLADSQIWYDGSFWNRLRLKHVWGDLSLVNQGEWYGSWSNQKLRQYTSFTWNTIRNRGYGVFSNGGFSITSAFSGEWNVSRETHSMNVGLSVSLAIPRLLPFSSWHFTYNLPLFYTVSLYPSTTIVLKQELALVLFSAEIQRGTPWLHLYFWRFVVALGYEGTWKDIDRGDFPLFALRRDWGLLEKSHTLSLSAWFCLSPNNNALALSDGKIGVSLLYQTGKAEPFSLAFLYSISST